MRNLLQQARETLDRLFQGSKHSVEVIAESLDRQAAIQKLTAQTRGLRRERNELITTIARKVYSLHTRGKVHNRDVLGDCRRTDEIVQQIQTLQQQIEEVRLQAMVGEELVVDIEDEAPVTEEAEEPEAALEPAEQQQGAQLRAESGASAEEPTETGLERPAARAADDELP